MSTEQQRRKSAPRCRGGSRPVPSRPAGRAGLWGAARPVAESWPGRGVPGAGSRAAGREAGPASGAPPRLATGVAIGTSAAPTPGRAGTRVECPGRGRGLPGAGPRRCPAGVRGAGVSRGGAPGGEALEGGRGG